MELILDKVSRQYGTKMACSNICLRLTPGVFTDFWAPTEQEKPR